MSNDSSDDAKRTKRDRVEVSSAASGLPTNLQQTLLLPQQGAERSCVPMPWIGFGTYKLSKASDIVGSALTTGYRSVDSAFIYGGEKTEPAVGAALEAALSGGAVRREDLFVTTKHWRKFHGYEPALACLQTSLHRLKLSHVDLWLMHVSLLAYALHCAPIPHGVPTHHICPSLVWCGADPVRTPLMAAVARTSMADNESSQGPDGGARCVALCSQRPRGREPSSAASGDVACDGRRSH